MHRYAPSCSQRIVLMSHFVVELPPTSCLILDIIDTFLMTKGEEIGSQTRVWYDGSCGIRGREGRSRYIHGTE
jgi:hypothetical protein